VAVDGAGRASLRGDTCFGDNSQSRISPNAAVALPSNQRSFAIVTGSA
jgi:hypothetical protein